MILSILIAGLSALIVGTLTVFQDEIFGSNTGFLGLYGLPAVSIGTFLTVYGAGA